MLSGLLLLVLNISVVGQSLNLTKYKNKKQEQTQIRVASASILPKKWDKELNWTRIEHAVTTAAKKGDAQIVVTPEGVLEGYVINEVNEVKYSSGKEEIIKKFFELAEPLNGAYIEKACNLSKRLNIYLVLGFLEKRNTKLYNSVILIDPDGDIVGRYSKTHFAQGYKINPNQYLPGDDYPVFNTPFGKVGMIICYDRQLPEPARIMALKGAQVLFVPAYGSYTEESGWNTVLMRTRAYENKFPVVFCNPFQSLLIDEDGDIRAIGKADEIVYFNINTDPKKYKDRFKNRRPKTYYKITE